MPKKGSVSSLSEEGEIIMWFRKEQGQAMVEFALVLPILILLICGIIDFGWIFGNQLIANNASREAARFCAISADLSQGDLETLAEGVVSNRADTLCNLCSVAVAVTEDTGNDDIGVAVSCDLPVLTPVASTIFGSTYSIQAVSVMRKE